MHPRIDLCSIIADEKLNPVEKLNRVRTLLDTKADPNYGGFFGNTPIMIATTQENIDIVQVLLDAKADPNIVNDDDDTPLMVAAAKGNRLLTEILILKGKAELEKEDGESCTAISWSINNKQLSTTALLLRQGAKIVIEDQEIFFRFLGSCDPRDPDFLFVLDGMCKQLRNKEVFLLEEEEEPDDEEEMSFLEKVESYMKKLQKLSLLDQKKVTEEIDKATNKKIYVDLLNVISSYDVALSHRQREDFVNDDIDSLLLENDESVEIESPAIVHLPGRARLFKPVEKVAQKPKEPEERNLTSVVWHF
ncbi:MAG: ankyrin repeat domain-containing protein [Gammaproteobacteria bacterium]